LLGTTVYILKTLFKLINAIQNILLTEMRYK